jgi:hypothetical protein
MPDAEGAAPLAVAVMARAPQAGRAKTRLIPLLGAEGAARLQGWLLARTLATVRAAAVGPLRLWWDGEAAAADGLDADATYPQAAGDLGERMLAAFRRAPPAGGQLLIGTDCPAMAPDTLRAAAAALRDHEAVLVPAEDGGYVLIGLRRAAAEVFAGVDWGSARVLAQTRARLAALGWRWLELPALWDIDRPDDFARLAALHPEVATVVGG